ncbi:PAS domain S-box protein [Ruficoccus amylovorans]|uniref:histidine kinase n=1 Tax=Ruficoccus amylovorans TaxID=1804625 RepID=A0A842HEI6_9BACT|nr:PAS domain S-box protein [Ruficoccus amylovorans]MBC2594066.1 PAS domain S-box protein [Ruficoccus amylovorans]
MPKKYTENVRILAVGLRESEYQSIARSLKDFSTDAEFVVASDWTEAKAVLNARSARFDVVLVDADRDRGAGWEECRTLLHREHTTPTILLDRTPSRERAQDAFKSGIQDYIEIDSDGRYLVYLPHTIVRIVDHYQAKWARKSAERAMERIAVSITALSGSAFFRELTRYITETLNLDYALVGEFTSPDKTRVRTLSFSSTQPGAVAEYPVAGAPCERLLNGEPFIQESGICQAFPEDKQLTELEAESYIGLPLLNQDKQVSGLLCVLHRERIDNLDFVLLALRAFATRAEMELERERTQDALQRQARILEQLGEAIIGADINGNIKFWNLQAESLFGLKAGDVLGSKLYRLLPEPDEQFVSRHFLEPLLIHGNHVVETRLRHNDGHVFHGHLSLSQEKNQRGEVVGVIACCRDISVRMQAEKQRQEAQQRLEFHVQRTPLAFIEWDLKCRITSWNPAAERIFGYHSEEIVGQSFAWLVHENFLPAGSEIFTNLLSNTGGFSSTNENVTRDGRIITCEWYNTPLMNEAGKIVGIASLVNDITDRIRYEQELKKSKEAADSANRSKDEFLAVMSHEIRTPMNSIIGFADLLREQTQDEDQLESIDIIKANAYTLLELINNVLNYSRLDSGRIVLENRDTELPLLLNEIEEAMGAEASQKNLELTCEIEEHTPHLVKTDYLELRQILLNVVGNAIKFTHQGSIRITVSARPTADKPGYWTYIFAVRDTGVGIPKDKLSTLFKSFSQVDSSSTRKFGGTGLGLAICRKICHLLGGDIWAESHENRGTTFYFTISGEVIAHSSEHPSLDSHMQPDEPLRILLVEDEAQTRQLLHEIIRQMGHECTTASCGEEAIDILRQRRFDLIFMDVEMSGMSGLETTHSIRQGDAGPENQGVFICALTAYTHGDDKQDCLDAGMNEHLGKPILTKSLKSILSKANQHKAQARA